MCDMTHFYVCLDFSTARLHMWFICGHSYVTRLIHTWSPICDTTHAYVVIHMWHDSFICGHPYVTRLMHMWSFTCDTTHSYVVIHMWHDSLNCDDPCVTRLIHMWSFIFVTTHSYVDATLVPWMVSTSHTHTHLHVTHTNESMSRTYEWVVSSTEMSHATHIWMGHVTHV